MYLARKMFILRKVFLYLYKIETWVRGKILEKINFGFLWKSGIMGNFPFVLVGNLHYPPFLP